MIFPFWYRIISVQKRDKDAEAEQDFTDEDFSLKNADALN